MKGDTYETKDQFDPDHGDDPDDDRDRSGAGIC